jgi:thiamine transport system permease protein
MAGRAQPLKSLSGTVTASLLALAVTTTFVAVFLRAEPTRGLTPADWAAIRFTVIQAVLSAGFSTLLAIPVARALARRQFRGRSFIITLLGAPFILPVVVAVMALLAVFGRNGWLNGILLCVGLEPVAIYGPHGVVLAHVFFNLPLATRLFLHGWQAVPAERFRLAAQLGFGPRELWRVIELPMLARVAPGAFAVILSICMTSFAVALTLGGGPRATTIELAIYQAFRFDFDLGKAAFLGLVQIVLVSGVVIVALSVARQDGFGGGLDRPVHIWGVSGPGARMWDYTCVVLVTGFLLLPIGTYLVRAIPGVLDLSSQVWSAALVSICVAMASTAMTLLLALPIAIRAAAGRALAVEVAGLLGLVASPLVVGTGLFLLINPWANPTSLALPVTALVNALMALPFVIRVLTPAVRDCMDDYGRLGMSLGLGGVKFIRIVLVPRIAGPLGFCAGLAAALSMGDLGVVALFADPETATLPLQMVRLMGAYRMEEAASAGVVLMGLSFGVFAIFDGLGRRYAGN